MKRVIISIILVFLIIGGASAKEDFEKISDDKYKLPKIGEVNTTIEMTQLNDTAITDPKMILDVWDGESKFKITFKSDSGEVKYDKEKIKESKLIWEMKDYDLDIISIDPSEENEYGGVEFNLTLYKKPDTNTWSFPIDLTNLVAYYQPALTPEEIAEGCERPDNVVGSYAVYHSSKRDNQYKTGKAFHIYRPKIIDSDGNWIWGELYLNDNVLNITVDSDWLKKAKYPVVVDPTIGYNVAGSSFTLTYGISGCISTYVESEGIVSSISAYIKASATYGPFHAVTHIYRYPGWSKISTDGTSELYVTSISYKWYNFYYNSSPILTEGESYQPVIWSDVANYIRYDSGSTHPFISTEDEYGPTWPETVSTFQYLYLLSIYATYNFAPDPTNLANTTGNFWINYTWDAGTGDVTDSFNVSINDTWYNGTTDTYINTSVDPHGYANIAVYAWNNTAGLSSGYISDNVSVPNNPPCLSNGEVSSASILDGQSSLITVDVSDIDGDSIASAIVEINGDNYTMSDLSGTWGYLFSTRTVNAYYITNFYAQDDEGAWNETTSTLRIDVINSAGSGGNGNAPTPTPTITPTETPVTPNKTLSTLQIFDIVNDDDLSFFKINMQLKNPIFIENIYDEDVTGCISDDPAIKSCKVDDGKVEIVFIPEINKFYNVISGHVTFIEKSGNRRQTFYKLTVIDLFDAIDVPDFTFGAAPLLLFEKLGEVVTGIRYWWVLLSLVIIGIIYRSKIK
jgi:hypothetical protein